MNRKATTRRALNVPLLSCSHSSYLRVKVTDEFRSQSMPKLSRNEDGTVRVLPVINLETGEAALLIALAVVESTLIQQPEGYVGKCYEIETGEVKPGKNYREVFVYEIDDPNEE